MLYIHEVNESESAEAYYGPFDEAEITERINDAYADGLAGFGGELDVVTLSETEASAIHINSREWWMEQLNA